MDGPNPTARPQFLGCFRATGATHASLEAATSQLRELSYPFPALGRTVSLLAGTPRRFSKAEARKRVDNSCGGGGRGNTGVALWEGSFVLAEWLSRQLRLEEARSLSEILGVLGSSLPSPFEALGGVGKAKSGALPAAVELGAGLGLPSILAAALGFDTVATDGDQSTLELLATNAERNAPESGPGSLRVAPLVWGTAAPSSAVGLSSPPRLILASDVVYGNDTEAWDALVHSMASLAGPDTLMVLSNMQR